MNPHSFTPRRKAQQPRRCVTRCGEMGGVGNQRGHISNYCCNDCFFARSLIFIFIISINTVALGSTPGSMESYLAVSLVGWEVVLPGSIRLHLHRAKQAQCTLSSCTCTPGNSAPSLSAWLRDFQSFALVGITSAFF